MLISTECLQRCGPWDESFFLYSEETEFGGFAAATPASSLASCRPRPPCTWRAVPAPRLDCGRSSCSIESGCSADVTAWCTPCHSGPLWFCATTVPCWARGPAGPRCALCSARGVSVRSRDRSRFVAADRGYAQRSRLTTPTTLRRGPASVTTRSCRRANSGSTTLRVLLQTRALPVKERQFLPEAALNQSDKSMSGGTKTTVGPDSYASLERDRPSIGQSLDRLTSVYSQRRSMSNGSTVPRSNRRQAASTACVASARRHVAGERRCVFELSTGSVEQNLVDRPPLLKICEDTSHHGGAHAGFMLSVQCLVCSIDMSHVGH